jgi:hypothetical protein
MGRKALATIFLFVSTVAAAVSGCASVPRYVNPAPSYAFTVHIWVAKHRYLPDEYVLRGCEMWAPKGVRCVRVSEPEHADITVVPADHLCFPDKQGKRTLATAYEGGKIAVVLDCFVDDKNKLDVKQFEAVLGHEIGHQMGMWEHVPLDCKEKHLTHPSGKPVCGVALMNPMYDADVTFITPNDSMAFDMRDLMMSAVSDKDPDSSPSFPGDTSGEKPICELRTR